MGPEERRFAVIWRLLAFGLLFLGVNKQQLVAGAM
jgi:hypothetical protein